MTELESLNRKKGALKAKLTSFQKFVQETKLVCIDSDSRMASATFHEFNSRLNKASELLEKFDEIQGGIEDIATNIEEQYELREQFESKFHAVVGDANAVLEKYAPSVVLSESDASSANSVNHAQIGNIGIKLPTISLPKFEGNFDAWLEFRDTFKSLIHENACISQIQKFHYLRSSLVGNAATVIQALEFSENNYEVAWQSLVVRFDNNRLLVNNHVKALFNLEPLQKESFSKIRNLMDSVNKNLRSLELLNQPTNQWDTLIIFIVASKLDPKTAREWEEFKAENEIPTLQDLNKFLKARADLLETLEIGSTVEEKPRFKKGTTKSLTVTSAVNSNKCVVCDTNEHWIYNCPTFLKLEVSDRISRARSLKLCLNCLKGKHFARNCTARMCAKCNAKHNTLLHLETNQHNNTTATLSASSGISQVLLSTVQVQVVDKSKRVHIVRALLDSGSQSSYIRSDLCERLALAKEEFQISVSGINQSVSSVSHKCRVKVEALSSAFEIEISCLVLPTITGIQSDNSQKLSGLPIPKNIKLADKEFAKSGEIGILIGAEYFWTLLCVGQIRLGKNLPVLHKTRFGWVVTGPVAESCSGKVSCNFSQNLGFDLQKFWEVEELSKNKIKLWTREEAECEQYFIDTVSRSEDGRFTVAIPLKECSDALGESRVAAERRFLGLEKKLAGNKVLREAYTSFLSEYEQLGHMTEVTKVDNNETAYYMPHHGVHREESSTTKLRVVFDCSAKTSTGKSYNDLQMVGPQMQSDLLAIILRFRKHTFVVCGDVEKMYRQVLVQSEQRPLQRILWRNDPSRPLKTYELSTVTYGTASAPFLAVRCLIQLAQDCESKQPDVAAAIKRDMYVDDLITGSDSAEEAVRICKGVSDVLKGGKFNLRKWTSNRAEMVNGLFDDSGDDSVSFRFHEPTKTLGLIWSTQEDVLHFHVTEMSGSKVTKRSALSDIAQIFDPLGLLSPCIILAKIFLQQLWLERLTWDESLPADLHTRWLKFRRMLVKLNTVRIPRHAVCDSPVQIEIHCFSDASQNAYGACAYMRSLDSYGNVSVHLLCSKARVSPLKQLTIPKLELCGAVVATKLVEKIRDSWEVEFHRCIFWTDSMIVLAWVKTAPSALKPFVGNRVAEIVSSTQINDEFRHVTTKDNPADLLSRGVGPGEMGSSSFWWKGPKWLGGDEVSWPLSEQKGVKTIPEMRKARQEKICLVGQDEPSLFLRFSSLRKLRGVVAHILRFKHNCLQKKNKISGSLSVSELSDAMKRLVKLAQKDDFSEELSRLTQGKGLRASSKILSLTPFVDDDHIIRVGGRLQNSKFEFEKKHPILLASNHPLTKLIFEEEHLKLLHAAPRLLLSSVRDRYWPTSGMNVSKRTVRACLRCFRSNPQIGLTRPIMGNLPDKRVEPAPAFHTTGVDYAGPFLIRNHKGRGYKTFKSYLCVFICFVTKAMHLEMVSDLSSENFLMAMRRFVSRRGKPLKMYSDNGTNFIGAQKDLQPLGGLIVSNEKKITESLAKEGIDWSFIPTHSPHFGGLWEAGVKSAKLHLKRVAGDARLTYEEFNTLVVQVEAVLNSRPLSPLSSDPNDFCPLTPAHFLVGRPLTALPDPDLRNIPSNRLTNCQHVQQLRQHFWSRWSQEYVCELQRRTKWKTTQSSLQEGALVLIKDNKLPTFQWKLGRIVTLHPGNDAINRVASIQTPTGIIKRSFSNLCVLPQ